MKLISLILTIVLFYLCITTIISMVKLLIERRRKEEMTVKGTLIGVNIIKSKKGTDCFFGNISTEFDEQREANGLGQKVIQVCAFGEDAVDLYAKCNKNGLVEEEVIAKGLYNGSTFQLTDIELS